MLCLGNRRHNVSPPERNPYTALKPELVRRLSPSKRAAHPQAPHTRGIGRPQTIPVSQTPEKPRPGFARRFPSHHLGQPTTLKYKGRPCWTNQGRLGHCSPLRRQHHGGCTPTIARKCYIASQKYYPWAASQSPQTLGGSTQNRAEPQSFSHQNFPLQLQTSVEQLQESPQKQQFLIWKCIKPLLVPSPLQSSGTEVYSALLLLTTRKTKTADVSSNTCLHYNHRLPLHHGQA
jgi:hypothetical protein